jgi:hypothetical protein
MIHRSVGITRRYRDLVIAITNRQRQDDMMYRQNGFNCGGGLRMVLVISGWRLCRIMLIVICIVVLLVIVML